MPRFDASAAMFRREIDRARWQRHQLQRVLVRKGGSRTADTWRRRCMGRAYLARMWVAGRLPMSHHPVGRWHDRGCCAGAQAVESWVRSTIDSSRAQPQLTHGFQPTTARPV